MKLCSGTRKQLALLAIGDPEAERNQELRAHLQACPDCRDYFAEISSVAVKLRAVQPDSGIRASDMFHRKTLEALNASERKSVIESLLFQGHSLLNWRVALPAVALAVVVVAVLSPAGRNPGANPVPAPSAHAETAANATADLDPTVARYELVANQSLEMFDELITLQGRRNSPSTPVYTASSLAHWEISD
jgi:anti-sigma factor RsiW